MKMENKQEITWQELIESKDFEQLSNSEKAFVLGISTEKEYRAERNVIIESRNITNDLAPLPLVLPEDKRAIVIPLYQTILAVAAAFVLGFFIFKSDNSDIEVNLNQTMANADTVYVEKIILDTIIETQTQTKYVLAENEGVSQTGTTRSERTNSLFSSQGAFEDDLSSVTLANKGTSAAKDETMILLEGWSATD